MKTHAFFKMGDDEPLAIFPRTPGTNDPQTVTVYRHTGQHGTATLAYLRTLRKAHPEESAPLEGELEAIGYDLAPVSGFHSSDFNHRARS